jgi:hypothetical protein
MSDAREFDVSERGSVGSIREAIRDYMGRGWSIIPIRAEDKRPLIRWEKFQHHHPDEEETRRWYSQWAGAGIGIVTGSVSGVVVIDVDVRHGGDVALAQLEREQGSLPTTIECRTGGGGRHLYFAHPGGLVRNKVGLAPGIDLRGDGGYVVAPPSRHASGRQYTWAEYCDPGSRTIAPLPDWLRRKASGESQRRGHPVPYWRHLVSDGVGTGERNNTIASLAGHLFRHGIDAHVVMELLLCWNRARCRPPLVDEEVAAVVTSICRLHDREAKARQQAR